MPYMPPASFRGPAVVLAELHQRREVLVGENVLDHRAAPVAAVGGAGVGESRRRRRGVGARPVAAGPRRSFRGSGRSAWSGSACRPGGPDHRGRRTGRRSRRSGHAPQPPRPVRAPAGSRRCAAAGGRGRRALSGLDDGPGVAAQDAREDASAADRSVSIGENGRRGPRKTPPAAACEAPSRVAPGDSGLLEISANSAQSVVMTLVWMRPPSRSGGVSRCRHVGQRSSCNSRQRTRRAQRQRARRGRCLPRFPVGRSQGDLREISGRSQEAGRRPTFMRGFRVKRARMTRQTCAHDTPNVCA